MLSASACLIQGTVKSRLSSTKSKDRSEENVDAEKKEDVLEFDDQFPLDDEAAWVRAESVVNSFVNL